MKKMPIVLFFVALTFICWGSYGPTLHLGIDAMGHSLWRPFMCVGLAYFFVAVMFPLIAIRNGETGRWTASGAFWSFLAGTIGAIGALGIVLAFKAGAKPIYVMPLVFGCAPIVNTLVTMVMNQSYRRVRIPFFLAIALVALGAAGVMRYKPTPAKAVAKASADADHGDEQKAEETEPTTDEKTDSEEADDESDDKAADAESPPTVEYDRDIFQWFTSIFAIFMTALCWGAYGPVLHLGQSRMEGSRLRPFICVGLAYFIIGVIVPWLVLSRLGEAGEWTLTGSLWSLAAGAAGAIGAMGIIYAFNNGGKPVYVMPLVFGGAPIINTLDSIGLGYMKSGTVGAISKPFLTSLGMVAVGAVCVLLFAPRKPKPVPVDEVPEPVDTGAGGPADDIDPPTDTNASDATDVASAGAADSAAPTDTSDKSSSDSWKL